MWISMKTCMCGRKTVCIGALGVIVSYLSNHTWAIVFFFVCSLHCILLL
uniref:Uncharacterized protein n=1 Tax=Anguilla anguilla TaxID=7936 RepID=A0A0E9VPA6_ANGAN